jgi:hypothetical protein
MTRKRQYGIDNSVMPSPPCTLLFPGSGVVMDEDQGLLMHLRLLGTITSACNVELQNHTDAHH